MRVMVQLFRFESQRDGQVTSGQAVSQTWRQHSHRRVRFVIDAKRLADDVSIRTKTLPSFVSENDDMVFARKSFFRQEIATEKESDALHPEKARSYNSAVNHLGLLGGSEVEAPSSPGHHVLKSRILPFPIEIVAGGDLDATFNLRPHHHQPICIRIG